ncbi:unnamed protein product [Mytilus edulis]|uniref:C2H2-type domain-containing protein n=1 Tax=Mytilus edulis TaxID=6550 RepID=A0A8S3VE49_MYTED|nr:unnamed protein product [Mytilus edulis]
MVFIPKYKYDRLIKDFENKQLNDEHHEKTQEDHTEETFTTENDIKPQTRGRCRRTKKNLKRHEKICIRASKSHKKQRQFQCRHCGLPFDTYEDLFDHINVEHPLNQTGGQAGQVMDQMHSITDSSPPLLSDPSISTLNPQIENINPLPSEKKRRNRRVKKSALNDSVNQIEIIPEGNEKYDLLQFFSNVKGDIQQIVESRKKYMRDIKWYLNVKVEMERDIQDGQTETVIPSFRSRNYVSLFNDNHLEHNLNEAYQKMHRSLEEYINRGSNWIIRKVVHLEARTVKYAPINGSSYMQLPSTIKHCKGVINIQNDDNKCFLWSVLAAIHPTDNNAHRVNKYKPFENELNTTGIDFPVPIKQVEKFEKLNNLSINVFGYEDFQKVQYPKEGDNILEFKDFYKAIKISFTIIADFECFSRKMDTSLPNPKKSSITPETKFEPSGYSYIVLCTNDDYSKPPVVYRGDRVIEHFFEDMAIEEEYINDILGEPEPLIMNDEAEQAFQLTTNCEVCQTLFDENLIKVRDHAHHGITRDPRK